jgi:hypothetical protein
MAENKKVLTEEFINQRVDEITGTSLYNYYKATPLNELRTRDEKLIKKELLRREKGLSNSTPKILNEEDDAPTAYGHTQGSDNVGNAPEEVANGRFLQQHAPFLAQFNIGPLNWLGGKFEKVAQTISGQGENFQLSPAEQGAVGLTVAALGVLAIGAAWKWLKKHKDLLKYFPGKKAITETMTVTEAEFKGFTLMPDSIFISEIANGVALLESASKKLNIAKKSKNSEDAEIIKDGLPKLNEKGGRLMSLVQAHANKMVTELLSDKEFFEYMKTNSPESLQKVEEYAKATGNDKKKLSKKKADGKSDDKSSSKESKEFDPSTQFKKPAEDSSDED